MEPRMDPRIRKRMLMFYFAAGVNLLMAFWVSSAGGGKIAGGTLTVIMLIFLFFAGVNYYMARRIAKQWAAHVRNQRALASEGNAGPAQRGKQSE